MEKETRADAGSTVGHGLRQMPMSVGWDWALFLLA